MTNPGKDTVVTDIPVVKVTKYNVLVSSARNMTKLGVMGLVGLAAGKKWISNDTAIAIAPMVLIFALFGVDTIWRKIDQVYREQAISILPVEAPEEQIKAVAAELNPLVKATTVTTITKEGEVIVDEKPTEVKSN